MQSPTELFRTFGIYFLLCAGACVLLGTLLLVIAVQQVRRLDIPPDADLTTTLQHVPLLLVVAIDLLDLGLDVLALPIVWVILDRMKLRALRNVSSIEALIPFTQPIPTMTLAWLAVRVFGVRF